MLVALQDYLSKVPACVARAQHSNSETSACSQLINLIQLGIEQVLPKSALIPRLVKYLALIGRVG
jgi:hypothetical protein